MGLGRSTASVQEASMHATGEPGLDMGGVGRKADAIFLSVLTHCFKVMHVAAAVMNTHIA
jgi:hypothetical protein